MARSGAAAATGFSSGSNRRRATKAGTAALPITALNNIVYMPARSGCHHGEGAF
jgi:hypothetical protein